MNKLPRANCLEYITLSALSVGGTSDSDTDLSPIVAVHTSYSSLVSARRTTAYSLPGAKKIGSGNVTFVATSPVLDV